MRASGQVCCATTSMLPLILLHQLFQVKFVYSCVELHMGFLQRGQWLVVWFCCTLLIHVLQNVRPQSSIIIGSSIKVSLKHEENMDFECSEFSRKRIKGTHESQSEDAKKNKKTAGNAGKCDQQVIRIRLAETMVCVSLMTIAKRIRTVPDPRLLLKLNRNIPHLRDLGKWLVLMAS